MWFDNPMIHGAIIVAVCYFLARWWYKKDEEVEDRRREAIRTAEKLRAGGQEWVADLVTDYAVGDYDEVGVKLAKMVALSKNDPAMKAELRKMALAALTGTMDDPAMRAEVVGKLEEYGDKVGDTVEGTAKPLIDPRVQKLVKALIDAKTAASAAAGVAPDAAKIAAEVAAVVA